MGTIDDHIYHSFIYALTLSGNFLKSSLYHVSQNWDKITTSTRSAIISQIEDYLRRHELLIAEDELFRTFAVDPEFSPQQRLDATSARAWLAFYRVHKDKIDLPSPARDIVN